MIIAELSAPDQPEKRFRANLAEINGRKVERCDDENTAYDLTAALRAVPH